jgi:hypothetical protein
VADVKLLDKSVKAQYIADMLQMLTWEITAISEYLYKQRVMEMRTTRDQILEFLSDALQLSPRTRVPALANETLMLLSDRITISSPLRQRTVSGTPGTPFVEAQLDAAYHTMGYCVLQSLSAAGMEL